MYLMFLKGGSEQSIQPARKQWYPCQSLSDLYAQLFLLAS